MPKKALESSVEKPCVEFARRNGVLVVKQTHQGAPSHPDRAFYFTMGKLLQIEFKRPGALPTPAQAHTIQQLRSRGFDVQIIDDKQTGLDLLRYHLQLPMLVSPSYINERTADILHKVLNNVKAEAGKASAHSAGKKVGTASVSKARRQVPAGTRMRGAVARPRSR